MKMSNQSVGFDAANEYQTFERARFFHNAFHFIHLPPEGQVKSQMINFSKKNFTKSLLRFNLSKTSFLGHGRVAASKRGGPTSWSKKVFHKFPNPGSSDTSARQLPEEETILPELALSFTISGAE